MNIDFRRATQADAEAMLVYLSEFWADGCDTAVQMPAMPDLEQEQQWLASRGGASAVVFLAMEEGRVIGMIEGWIQNMPEFQHNCEFGMGILKKYRQKGIGKKLVQCILDWAHEKKLMRVELNVFSNNLAGIALYTRMGFSEDGRRKIAVKLRDGSYCDLIHMFRTV